MKQMMDLENYFIECGKHDNRDVLIITDRGVMDPKAYEDPSEWEEILREGKWNEDNLMNERYDLVLHLVTCADGKEEFYTNENNTARSETAEEARILDSLTQAVWLNHTNFKIFDNSAPSFVDKLNKVTQAIGNLVDYLPAFDLNQKFLLSDDIDVESAIPPVITRTTYREIVNYLVSDDPKSKSVYLMRRINKHNKSLHSHNTRFLSKNIANRRENRRKITKEVYRLFMNQKESHKKTLYKRITAFNYYNQNFLIEEHFKDAELLERHWAVLRFDKPEADQGVKTKLPKFLEIGEDVSTNKKYYSWCVADL
jgi:hypothetical protein